MTNKTYSTKSNARRAARKATGGDEGSFEVYEVEGGYSWREIDADTPDLETVSDTQKEAQNQDNANTDPDGRRRKSEVENPVALVWRLAEERKGSRRKDVVNECIRRGVAYNTARTQYQWWFQATKAAEQTANNGNQ